MKLLQSMKKRIGGRGNSGSTSNGLSSSSSSSSLPGTPNSPTLPQSSSSSTSLSSPSSSSLNSSPQNCASSSVLPGNSTTTTTNAVYTANGSNGSKPSSSPSPYMQPSSSPLGGFVLPQLNADKISADGALGPQLLSGGKGSPRSGKGSPRSSSKLNVDNIGGSSSNMQVPALWHSNSTSNILQNKQKGNNNETSSPYTVSPFADDSGSNPFAELPTLRETLQCDRANLFIMKLEACSVVYDFHQNTKVKQKEEKRQALLEIVEYVNNTRNCFNDQIMANIVSMVGENIFRALPPACCRTSLVYDPEDDEPTLEPSWPHLQIVYEFFLRFVVSNDVDPKVVKKHIDQKFVLRLLELFNSEDPRERDYLKTILHRIYGKIMVLRSFIRKSIQFVFYKFIYETEIHNGISELLEILGSIINGFALPLKEEHQLFLNKSIIPLHKTKTLNAFHQQLTYCLTQYVEKDSRLSECIINGMLRFWPRTNTPKEVLFLNELEEILELTQPPEFQKVMLKLFSRLALSIQSPHFQVAERVLFLWNNDHIVKMINQHRNVLFPIVIPALYKNSKLHWNSTVNGLTFNVSKLLADSDPALFDACSEKQTDFQNFDRTAESARNRRWAHLERCFQKQHGENNETKVNGYEAPSDDDKEPTTVINSNNADQHDSCNTNELSRIASFSLSC